MEEEILADRKNSMPRLGCHECITGKMIKLLLWEVVDDFLPYGLA